VPKLWPDHVQQLVRQKRLRLQSARCLHKPSVHAAGGASAAAVPAPDDSSASLAVTSAVTPHPTVNASSACPNLSRYAGARRGLLRLRGAGCLGQQNSRLLPRILRHVRGRQQDRQVRQASWRREVLHRQAPQRQGCHPLRVECIDGVLPRAAARTITTATTAEASQSAAARRTSHHLPRGGSAECDVVLRMRRSGPAGEPKGAGLLPQILRLVWRTRLLGPPRWCITVLRAEHQKEKRWMPDERTHGMHGSDVRTAPIGTAPIGTVPIGIGTAPIGVGTAPIDTASIACSPAAVLRAVAITASLAATAIVSRAVYATASIAGFHADDPCGLLRQR